MFRRILIANRGEIAARIARACDAVGAEAVIVHSEADRGAPWLRHAVKTVCIGPPPATRSYLDADAVLQAADQTDCQALHPGYGFLAENALFAARCEQRGLTFIGPGPEAIRRMGDKAEAKRTMAAHGLSTIPGSEGLIGDPDHARRLAASIGYPVLLKATAGGGGRGMRRCADEGQLQSAFREAQAEADKAFGDAGLYLERLIEGGRHIEFQLLADGRSAVHLGERECSVQRNHQKLIEESPSPALDSATRNRVGEQVARTVASLGYRNAGTVEFLREPGGELFFMEMNTRLQVEHPVSEMVTGIDLVVEQLHIAAGASLSLPAAPPLQGHAIEFRINAEDVDDGFRPDPGRITAFSPPRVSRVGAEVRWDSAIEEGYAIPPHYDSMIGKLIVCAADRDGALAAAREALATLRVEGVKTTVDLHRRIVDDPVFVSGDYDVRLLQARRLVGTG